MSIESAVEAEESEDEEASPSSRAVVRGNGGGRGRAFGLSLIFGSARKRSDMSRIAVGDRFWSLKMLPMYNDEGERFISRARTTIYQPA